MKFSLMGYLHNHLLGRNSNDHKEAYLKMLHHICMIGHLCLSIWGAPYLPVSGFDDGQNDVRLNGKL